MRICWILIKINRITDKVKKLVRTILIGDKNPFYPPPVRPSVPHTVVLFVREQKPQSPDWLDKTIKAANGAQIIGIVSSTGNFYDFFDGFILNRSCSEVSA